MITIAAPAVAMEMARADITDRRRAATARRVAAEIRREARAERRAAAQERFAGVDIAPRWRRYWTKRTVGRVVA